MRLRAGLVVKLINECEPDIICLQETKCPPGQFPSSTFSDHGYPYIADNGFTGHHGVAIVSRLPFDHSEIHTFCGKNDGRHISIKPSGTNITVHSLYVPSGGDEPDPDLNEKFSHKLQFLEEMQGWIKSHADITNQDHVFTADLNLAPLENDVSSHKQLLKVVSHTPVETQSLLKIMEHANIHDPIRTAIPEPEKIYSWWSYRSRDWEVANKGRRLDHIWVTPGLSQRCKNPKILKNARGWDRPSDHVPVIIEIL